MVALQEGGGRCNLGFHHRPRKGKGQVQIHTSTVGLVEPTIDRGKAGLPPEAAVEAAPSAVGVTHDAERVPVVRSEATVGFVLILAEGSGAPGGLEATAWQWAGHSPVHPNEPRHSMLYCGGSIGYVTAGCRAAVTLAGVPNPPARRLLEPRSWEYRPEQYLPQPGFYRPARE